MESIPPDATKKHCPRCHHDLPATTEFFSRQSRAKDGLRYFCKSCRHNDYVTSRPFDPRPKLSKEDARKNRATYQSQWRTTHPRSTPRVRKPGEKKRDHATLRRKVLAAYGGKCIHCGEASAAFLTVDHVGNNGAEHRRSLGNKGRFYTWLRQHSFPQEGFQLLCHNCNWTKFSCSLPSPYSKKAAYVKRWRDTLRQDVLTAYGGKCACCGEAHSEVLTIDHIQNGGNDQRHQVGGGSHFYAWLRKHGFPQEGFQLLCRNCNHAKFSYGICPHQNDASSL